MLKSTLEKKNMMPNDENNFLCHFLQKIPKYRFVICAFFLVLATLCMSFLIENFQINTNTEDLLSKNLEWRKNYTFYKNNFPNESDSILIIVESNSIEIANIAARNIHKKLSQKKDLFEAVFWHSHSDFFKKNKFLFLSPVEIQELSEKIVKSQPFIGALMNNPSAIELLRLSRLFIEKSSNFESEEKDQFLTIINQIFVTTLQRKEQPISWLKFLNESNNKPTRLILLAKPKLFFNDVLPGEQSIKYLKDIIEIEHSISEDLNVSLTGSAALSHEELKSVTEGATKTAGAALFLVLLILFIGLKSFSLVVITIINLAVGLIFTASFAVFVVGTLNMISIAFAVLYVGLAVDFTIHISLRYRELLVKMGKKSAIVKSMTQLNKSIALCALTTSLGFLAFLPTNYKGVAELGLISGVGMIISFILCLTFLPSLFSIFPEPEPLRLKEEIRTPRTRSKKVGNFILLTLLVLLLGIFSLKFSKFDNNPVNLNNQKSEAVTTLNRLSNSELAPSFILLEKDKERTINLQKKLDSFKEIKETTSIYNFIPKNQSQKIEIIENLNFIVGGNMRISKKQTTSPDTLLTYISELKNTLESNVNKSILEREFEHTIRTLEETMMSSNRQKNETLINLMNYNAFHFFPYFLNFISEGLNPEIISIENIPRNFRELWLSENSLHKIEIIPTAEVKSKSKLKSLITEIEILSQMKLTGAPIINLEASNSVISAFTQALLTAIVLIITIIFFTFKNKKTVIIIFLPIFVAWLATANFLIIIDQPFNFANIIALPLLMGIGIDSAIHIFHRKINLNDRVSFFETSTSRAVILSSLTTMASFGSLLLSSHDGTASLGMVLSVGLLFIVVSTLVLLPALADLLQINKKIS